MNPPTQQLPSLSSQFPQNTLKNNSVAPQNRPDGSTQMSIHSMLGTMPDSANNAKDQARREQQFYHENERERPNSVPANNGQGHGGNNYRASSQPPILSHEQRQGQQQPPFIRTIPRPPPPPPQFVQQGMPLEQRQNLVSPSPVVGGVRYHPEQMAYGGMNQHTYNTQMNGPSLNPNPPNVTMARDTAMLYTGTQLPSRETERERVERENAERSILLARKEREERERERELREREKRVFKEERDREKQVFYTQHDHNMERKEEVERERQLKERERQSPRVPFIPPKTVISSKPILEYAETLLTQGYPKQFLGTFLYSPHAPPASLVSLEKLRFVRPNCEFAVVIPHRFLEKEENHRLEGREIWGSEVYTDDSDFVAMLFHSLLEQSLTKHGEDVLSSHNYMGEENIEMRIRVLPRLVQYAQSYRGGLLSRGWYTPHDGLSYMPLSAELVSSKKGLGLYRGREVVAAQILERHILETDVCPTIGMINGDNEEGDNGVRSIGKVEWASEKYKRKRSKDQERQGTDEDVDDSNSESRRKQNKVDGDFNPSEVLAVMQALSQGRSTISSPHVAPDPAEGDEGDETIEMEEGDVSRPNIDSSPSTVANQQEKNEKAPVSPSVSYQSTHEQADIMPGKPEKSNITSPETDTNMPDLVDQDATESKHAEKSDENSDPEMKYEVSEPDYQSNTTSVKSEINPEQL